MNHITGVGAIPCGRPKHYRQHPVQLSEILPDAVGGLFRPQKSFPALLADFSGASTARQRCRLLIRLAGRLHKRLAGRLQNNNKELFSNLLTF
jgi:hypothetical protein